MEFKLLLTNCVELLHYLTSFGFAKPPFIPRQADSSGKRNKRDGGRASRNCTLSKGQFLHAVTSTNVSVHVLCLFFCLGFCFS